MNRGFKIGDFVSRLSHHKDILFQIEDIYHQNNMPMALLKGVDLRLRADASVDDLEAVSMTDVNHFRQKYVRKSTELMRNIEKRRHNTIDSFLSRAKINYKRPEMTEMEIFEMPGTVLHLDGDREYLDLCLATYRQLGLKAHGFFVPEAEQANVVKDYLSEYAPDILVITGHDGFLRGRKNFSSLESYRNSKSFVRAVRRAREYAPGRDDLIIFAGACQSHYESLISAGANFASSPKRVLIHAYDPVFIAEKVAFTPFNQMVPIKETVRDTITGTDGVGGVETHGRLRLGYPKSPY